ncbi:MAG: nuclear transport factor 2 family protein [Chloroflexi bacterium]|nr:MAG: nuclear transport factor 2 family protein [Chloroflexota bacterium]
MATKDTVEAYMAAWNEPDEKERRALLERAWEDGATYTDPMSHAAGREALIALIAQFHTQMPGAKILPSSGIDEHHGLLRFAWKMERDSAAPMEGIDIGEVAEDGRLRSIVGFFGPLPAA